MKEYKDIDVSEERRREFLREFEEYKIKQWEDINKQWKFQEKMWKIIMFILFTTMIISVISALMI